MTSIKSREDGGKSNRLRSAILLATAMQSHCESLWDLMSITQAVQRRNGSRGGRGRERREKEEGETEKQQLTSFTFACGAR